ncbi:IS4 family transposase [bacterium]|nr:IS4 family transposase [bacterium]
MDNTSLIQADWPYLLDLLPADLEESAVNRLALLRRREVDCAASLLRLALCYGFCDLSLRQTAAQAELLGLGHLSDVAVLKRLKKAADWLGHLVLQFLRERGLASEVPPLAVRVVDATTISAPGSKGTDWRLHLELDLEQLCIVGVELTGPEGGESFLRHAAAPGQVFLADRGYAHREGVASLLDQGAEVVLRLNWHNFPLETLGGKPLDLVTCAETLGPGEIGDWAVQFRAGARTYQGRLLVLPKTQAAAEKAQRQIRHEATRKGRKPDARSLRAAHFICLFVTLPQEQLAAAQAFELYRLRWQIEIVFKRLKGLLHLDHLRAKDPALARTYLYAKILGALLVDELSRSALSFFPWGYRLFPTAHLSLALAQDAGGGSLGCDPRPRDPDAPAGGTAPP